jgi:hypothetical protein
MPTPDLFKHLSVPTVHNGTAADEGDLRVMLTLADEFALLSPTHKAAVLAALNVDLFTFSTTGTRTSYKTSFSSWVELGPQVYGTVIELTGIAAGSYGAHVAVGVSSNVLDAAGAIFVDASKVNPIHTGLSVVIAA